MATVLRNISEIRRFFHRNEDPIYFISATNFNLLAEADDSSCVGGRIVGAKLDIWAGISGAMVSDLTSNPAYLAEMPTSTEVLTNGALLEVPAVLSAGPNDNDAGIVAWGVGLTGCARCELLWRFGIDRL